LKEIGQEKNIMTIKMFLNTLNLKLEYQASNCVLSSLTHLLLMYCMKILKILGMQVLAGIFLISVYAAEESKAPATRDLFRFKWAFIIRDHDGKTRTADFNDKVTVKKGDAIRIYLEPVTSVYLYLYMFSAQKELECLFPANPDFYEQNVKTGTQHLLPGAEKWFIMDEKAGTERFYLLASSSRLSDIETLTKKMLSNPKDTEVKARLLDEIKTVRRSKGDLNTPVEKGVPIAGTVVAVTRGPAQEATLTEAAGFFSKTLRIEHE
jgi:hypothetical protein